MGKHIDSFKVFEAKYQTYDDYQGSNMKWDLQVDAELKQYFKDNQYTPDSPVTHSTTAANYVKQKAEEMGKKLTPAEKAKITKKAWAYQEKAFMNRYNQKRAKEEREDEKRKKNNLLPLVINDKAGTPDSKYYEYKNTYNQTRKGLPTLTHHHDPKSGYVTFQLKDKWKNTKFDQDTLDKYWAAA